MKIPYFQIFFALLGLLFGCNSVHENLDQQYDRVAKIYSETYNKSESKEVKELGWGDAQAMLLKNNLDV